ncbi:MAG: hypothetical protein WDM85_03365 [Caulobacteraceae bacterium]
MFDTLQTYLGSTFNHTFNYLNHTYQVYAQADWPFRHSEAAINELKTRSASGAMVPLGDVREPEAHPPAPTGCCATTSIPAPRSRPTPPPASRAARRSRRWKRRPDRVLPSGFGFEWTDLAPAAEVRRL